MKDMKGGSARQVSEKFQSASQIKIEEKDGAGGEVYEYSGFQTPRTTPDSWDSLYRIQMGVRVDF